MTVQQNKLSELSMAGKNGKKEEKSENIVLKLEMHCEGCTTKILKTARSIQGVDRATADSETNKLTVRATTEPAKLREELQKRTKKKVELISPQSKKENKGEKEKNNSVENKSDAKQPDEKKSKEPPETTAVLKLQLHCTGCLLKIHKIASKFKGVDKVTMDKEKDLLTVKGKMDTKALVQSLAEKMKRPVEIIPPKKDKENNGVKDGGNGGGGGKKKVGGDGAVEVTEGNRLEYIGFPGYPSVPVYEPGFAYPPDAPEPADGYPLFGNPHPPQVFSDENPNACSIM